MTAHATTATASTATRVNYELTVWTDVVRIHLAGHGMYVSTRATYEATLRMTRPALYARVLDVTDGYADLRPLRRTCSKLPKAALAAVVAEWMPEVAPDDGGALPGAAELAAELAAAETEAAEVLPEVVTRENGRWVAGPAAEVVTTEAGWSVGNVKFTDPDLAAHYAGWLARSLAVG